MEGNSTNEDVEYKDRRLMKMGQLIQQCKGDKRKPGYDGKHWK